MICRMRGFCEILQQKLFCDGPAALPITIAYFVDTAIVALEVVEVVPETAKGSHSLQSLGKQKLDSSEMKWVTGEK